MQFYTLPGTDKKHFEKSVLVLLKFQSRWNDHVLRKLALKFNVYWCYINDAYPQLGSVAFTSQILQFSNQQNITSILLDIEFFPSFHIAAIDLLRTGKPKLGVLLFDDAPLHLANRVFASRADFIVTTCPLSNFKYQEMGMVSTWAPLESDSLYYCQTTGKTTDILFFGSTTASDRSEYLAALHRAKGMSKVIFDPAIDGFLDQSAFARLLASAKVIVNLSKSDIVTNAVLSPRPSNIMYQLKSRIGEALFSGSLCISEYAPQHQLLNMHSHLSEFRTPEELVERVESYDYGDAAVKRRFDAFYNECWPKYCDANVMNNLDQLLNQLLLSEGSTFTRSRHLIDDRYFSSTSTALKQYFAHNQSLCQQELDLLEKCE